MKTKTSYKVSKTEFWLLMLLGIIAIIALGVTYLISPAWDGMAASSSTLLQAELRLASLKNEYGNLAQYKTQLTAQNTELNSLHEQIPAYYSQEKGVSALDEAAASSGLDLVSIAFSGVKTDPKATFIPQLKNQKPDTQAAPAANSAGTVHVSEVVRYERMKLGFQGTYPQFCQFLDDVAAQPRKLFVRDLALSRAKGGVITGSMTLLAMSGAAAEGDAYPGYTFDTPQIPGKADPFAAFPGLIEEQPAAAAEEQAAVLNPDFYIIINTYDDNAAKVMMGKNDTGASELKVKDNKAVAASIVFSEAGGQITYAYVLDGQSYKGVMQLANATDPIVLSVLSRARKDAKDSTGVTLSVTNNTARQVTIDVRNDDLSKPRFALGATTGAVKLG